MSFRVKVQSGAARIGELTTAHGKIETPFFMPVGSKGSVKAMSGSDLESLGYEALISNSFLLSIVPGVDVVEEAGGIHKFMNFNKGIFTDSGGFQVLSKDFLVKKTEEGATFKDKTGQKKMYTPEMVVDNQLKLGSDVAMTLDDVAHYGMNGKEYVDAIKRTHNWAKRCLDRHQAVKDSYNSKQLLFGICQGGTLEEYRRFSTHKINELGFDGVALGGLVIGESRNELLESIKTALSHFDDNKIKYLMGLGSPPDIVKAIGLGVDCFDSIYPTSNARHGSMLTRKGRIALKKTVFKDDYSPIEESCACESCKKYTRAYLHHLLRTHELLGYHIATVHNLHFMKQLIEDCKQAIREDRYEEFQEAFLHEYFSGKEKKEFSNHIKKKYMAELQREERKILLDWKG